MDLSKQPETIAEALALSSQWNFKHLARIAELEAALAEAKEDSARLTWLIDASNNGASDWLGDGFWDSLPGYTDDVQVEGRAAIDAARSGS